MAFWIEWCLHRARLNAFVKRRITMINLVAFHPTRPPNNLKTNLKMTFFLRPTKYHNSLKLTIDWSGRPTEIYFRFTVSYNIILLTALNPPENVMMDYMAGNFLRCHWDPPLVGDLPVAHYKTFLHHNGRQDKGTVKGTQPYVEFERGDVKPNEQYGCEIIACYIEVSGRELCSAAAPTFTMTSPPGRTFLFL